MWRMLRESCPSVYLPLCVVVSAGGRVLLLPGEERRDAESIAMALAKAKAKADAFALAFTDPSTSASTISAIHPIYPI